MASWGDADKERRECPTQGIEREIGRKTESEGKEVKRVKEMEKQMEGIRESEIRIQNMK